MHPASPRARYAIAGFGELVADPSRVAMLLALMDGVARPATELARIAGVAPSTASAHLLRLTTGRLLRVEPQGRHRYFRLAGDHVADALEVLAVHAAPRDRQPPPDPARDALAHARTCYRHLAGRLGVAVFVALERRGLLHLDGGAVSLTAPGVRTLGETGLVVAARVERVQGKPCLDWTERRHHLGGALGVLLTQHMLGVGWLARRREARALRVTAACRAGLARLGVPADVVDRSP